MSKDLTLDDMQAGQIKVMFDQHDKTFQELQEQLAQRPEDTAKMAALREELKVARESGDRDQMLQISEKFREFRKESDNRSIPIRGKMAEAREQLRTGIIGVLRDDQKKKFDELWETNVTRTARGYQGRMRNPQSLRAMVSRLKDMSSTQKTQVDEFFALYKATIDDPNNKPADRTMAEKRLFDQVLNALTPEQREKVESQLIGRRGRRESGEGRPGEAPDAPPPPTSQP
jgi:hypothetical protein